MSKDRDDVGLIVFALFVGVPLLIGVLLVGRAQWFTDGYCAALGGEQIDIYVCDVDGKVVRV